MKARLLTLLTNPQLSVLKPLLENVKATDV